MNKILFNTRQSCLINKNIANTLATCLICQDIPIAPVECEKCKSIFCQICTLKWKENSTVCPNRCSSKWGLRKLKIPSYILKCPYSEKCSSVSEYEFQSHLLTCKQAPKEVRQAYKLKSNYLCVKEHKLVFNSERFAGQYLVNCFECGESKYCRNQCTKCEHFYCGSCRLPPLTKKYCPGKSHQYINKNPHPGFACEMCGLQPQVLGIRCYDDMSCNFGLCERCYDELPDESILPKEDLPNLKVKWLMKEERSQEILNPEMNK